MGERYSGTAVPFGAMSLREIRDPVTAGTGTESMNAAADALDSVARRLADLNARMGAVERAYAEAHEGEAAEETKVYLRKLGEPGRVGEITFGSAGRALREQATYYDAARRDLAGIPDTPGPPTRTAAALSDRNERAASDIAGRYQENSNANLTLAFESFTPISLPNPDLTPAVTPEITWPAGAATTVAPMSVAGPATGPGAAAGAPLTSSAPGGSDAAGFAALGGVAGAAGDGRRGAGATALDPAGTRGSGPPGAPGGGAATGGLGAGGVGGAAASGGPGGSAVRSAPGTAGGPGPVGPSGGRGLETGRAPGPGRVGAALDGGRGVGGSTPPRPGSGGDGLLGPRVPRAADGPFGAADAARPGRLGAPEDTGVRGRLGGPEEPGARARVGELGARGVLGERAPGVGAPEEVARGAQARPSSSTMPFVPGGAAGMRSGEAKGRPDWLVEEDPEGAWLGEVPPYGPPVLGRDV